jgi:hypothetical protein
MVTGMQDKAFYKWGFGMCYMTQCAALSIQSGEKTALAIAILVSQTLYFTLVIEVIPATSLTLPLLGRQL